MPTFKCQSCDKTFLFKSRFFKHLSSISHIRFSKNKIKELTISIPPTFSKKVNQSTTLQDRSDYAEEEEEEEDEPICRREPPTSITRLKGHNVATFFSSDTPTDAKINTRYSQTELFDDVYDAQITHFMDPFILELFSTHGFFTLTISFFANIHAFFYSLTNHT